MQVRENKDSLAVAEPAVRKDNNYTKITVPPDSLYNKILLHLVHNRPGKGWPVNSNPPLPGAILPFNRIVAYYGNLYSTGMGILGELKPQEMLARLELEVKKWAKADSILPVLPALHYIAVTAQARPGNDKKYRLRMPSTEIDKVIQMAGRINALVFLDIQVGHSTLQQEIPLLEKYLALPQVHLGIDPEYSMKGGQAPATVIGSFNATDINYAVEFLKNMVNKYNLPPKILVVHRFTQAMISDHEKISILPEVQVVIHMDGFGSPAKKIDSYNGWVSNQPVQFTGFKLFYKNDKPRLMTPQEILKLFPMPVYIQYQ